MDIGIDLQPRGVGSTSRAPTHPSPNLIERSDRPTWDALPQDIYENIHTRVCVADQINLGLVDKTQFEIIQKDPKLVLAAVKRNGLALRWASPALQNNPEVVLAAVTNNPRALQWASLSLRNKAKELPKEPFALRWAGPEVQKNHFLQNPRALQWASMNIRDNPEIVPANALLWASPRLRDDFCFVLNCVHQDVRNLYNASNRLINDRFLSFVAKPSRTYRELEFRMRMDIATLGAYRLFRSANNRELSPFIRIVAGLTGAALTPVAAALLMYSMIVAFEVDSPRRNDGRVLRSAAAKKVRYFLDKLAKHPPTADRTNALETIQAHLESERGLNLRLRNWRQTIAKMRAQPMPTNGAQSPRVQNEVEQIVTAIGQIIQLTY